MSFQNGVDTITNKCTSCGSTPTESTPSAICTSIENIYNTGKPGNVTLSCSGPSLNTSSIECTMKIPYALSKAYKYIKFTNKYITTAKINGSKVSANTNILISDYGTSDLTCYTYYTDNRDSYKGIGMSVYLSN